MPGLVYRFVSTSCQFRPNRDDIDKVIKLALSRPIAKNMPMPVTHATVKEAILNGDKLGLAVTNEIGDDAYRRLHD